MGFGLPGSDLLTGKRKHLCPMNILIASGSMFVTWALSRTLWLCLPLYRLTFLGSWVCDKTVFFSYDALTYKVIYKFLKEMSPRTQWLSMNIAQQFLYSLVHKEARWLVSYSVTCSVIFSPQPEQPGIQSQLGELGVVFSNCSDLRLWNHSKSPYLHCALLNANQREQ